MRGMRISSPSRDAGSPQMLSDAGPVRWPPENRHPSQVRTDDLKRAAGYGVNLDPRSMRRGQHLPN